MNLEERLQIQLKIKNLEILKNSNTLSLLETADVMEEISDLNKLIQEHTPVLSDLEEDEDNICLNCGS